MAEHGDLALERLDGSEAEPERLQEALTSLPFLAARKLVIIRDGAGNKAFAEQAPELLKAVPETTDVVLVEPKLDKRSSYYKYLKAHTDFLECKQLDAGGLASRLVAAAKEQGGSLSSSDARYLIDRVGSDQQLLMSELEKLVLYDPDVSRHSIDLLTEPAPQSTIFQLLDAAFAGNRKHALALYREQRALKVEPQQIVAMLGWQLHVLALLKTAGDRTPDEVAKAAKVSPYTVKKSVTIARRLTRARLTGLIDRLVSIDQGSKRGKLDLDEALQNYILLLAEPV